MKWKMRWHFFWAGLTLSVFWMIAIIGVSLYIFSITRNPLSFLATAATALPLEFMR